MCGLKCELMSELGALLMHTGDTKLAYISNNSIYTISSVLPRLAAQWWERALIMLVGVADHHLVSAAAVVESSGLWGCLLAGVLAARLAQLSDQDNMILIIRMYPLCRYVYYNELDNHKIYVDMSAALLKVSCTVHSEVIYFIFNRYY